MTKRILLTGSTGFVGTQVLRELTRRGMSVVVVVRSGSEAKVSSIPGVDSVISTPDLFQEGCDWWRHACAGVDTAVHAAWYAEPGEYLQSPKNIECLMGTVALARGAAEAGVRRLVGIGTCFEYELSGGLLTVDTPLRPLTPYAGAKAAAYLALLHCLPAMGVEFAWCRLFYLYGEGEDERRLVPHIRNRLAQGEPAELTSGNQIRDFLDVEEAAKKIVDVADGTAQGAMNICSGIPTSVRQLAERIADEYGRRDLLRFGARPDNLVDPPCVVGASE